MRKGSKPVIVSLFFVLLVITGIVLASIGTRFKYEELVRQTDDLSKQLKAEQTKHVTLIANYQMYTEEFRIKEIASNQLGMVEGNDNNLAISINKKDVDELLNYLNHKHE
jgi:cell division protein FtsL